MKRKQIVERIAVEREVPLHTAADWLDSFLFDLIQHLNGITAPAPSRDDHAGGAKGHPTNAK